MKVQKPTNTYRTSYNKYDKFPDIAAVTAAYKLIPKKKNANLYVNLKKNLDDMLSTSKDHLLVSMVNRTNSINTIKYPTRTLKELL